MQEISPKSDFIFIPQEIEINDEQVVVISKIANIFFEKLKDLGNSVYIIEQDVQTVCTGDFGYHFEEGKRGHSPFPFLKKFKENFQDTLSTPLRRDKPLFNGELSWTIPTYLYDTKKNPIYAKGDHEAILNFSFVDESSQTNFEELNKNFDLIQKIEIVQSFILNNGVLSFEKGGYKLFFLDLKQYPHIFKCFQ